MINDLMMCSFGLFTWWCDVIMMVHHMNYSNGGGGNKAGYQQRGNLWTGPKVVYPFGGHIFFLLHWLTSLTVLSWLEELCRQGVRALEMKWVILSSIVWSCVFLRGEEKTKNKNWGIAAKLNPWICGDSLVIELLSIRDLWTIHVISWFTYKHYIFDYYPSVWV